MKKIVIQKVINNSLAVNTEQGKMVFTVINEALNHGEKITIDFTGLSTITTAFLNLSIGRLYQMNTQEELKERINVDLSTLSLYQQEKLQRVIDNVKVKIDDEKLNEG
ncbi:STAS-like domain-containing protein [Companilactobacillus ginsenosidimutans]|uniref:DUF4325 domain-containing protein n=1 Tax=Companilactobacillus ginsenosidimutans TaxID=1007676 RepID=A0A0H4QG67_9LACO|nr:STAS-like domain-containing protein [Companilactobacillus ginsenosidimutans]AKP67389.1 hypothetical protein ABM34_07455 [Companilactobacillus ginsenosidimutans]